MAREIWIIYMYEGHMYRHDDVVVLDFDAVYSRR
jgi:hypothetical protein